MGLHSGLGLADGSYASFNWIHKHVCSATTHLGSSASGGRQKLPEVKETTGHHPADGPELVQ